MLGMAQRRDFPQQGACFSRLCSPELFQECVLPIAEGYWGSEDDNTGARLPWLTTHLCQQHAFLTLQGEAGAPQNRFAQVQA